MKVRKKYYEVRSRRLRYGIFPFSKDGEKQAKAYVKLLTLTSKEKLDIVASAK